MPGERSASQAASVNSTASVQTFSADAPLEAEKSAALVPHHQESALPEDKVEEAIEDSIDDWEHDPANGRNWGRGKKWGAVAIVSEIQKKPNSCKCSSSRSVGRFVYLCASTGIIYDGSWIARGSCEVWYHKRDDCSNDALYIPAVVCYWSTIPRASERDLWPEHCTSNSSSTVICAYRDLRHYRSFTSGILLP